MTTRRRFFALLASAAVATAADTTRLGLTLRSVLPDRKLSLIELLEARIRAAEKMMAQQLSGAIYGDGSLFLYNGYELLTIKPPGGQILAPVWGDTHSGITDNDPQTRIENDAEPRQHQTRYASFEVIGP